MRNLLLALVLPFIIAAGLVSVASASVAAPLAPTLAQRCVGMTADTPLTPANAELAALCPATRAPASAFAHANMVTPDAGGPSCQYFDLQVSKVCYQRGKGTLVSEWGSPVGQFNHGDGVNLWHWLGTVTHNRYLRACTGGAIGGVVASATTAGLTVFAGATGGCLGGTLVYWWTK